MGQPIHEPFSNGSPFAVYVHIPYCARKCPYCDFNVHVERRVPEDAYARALLLEIDRAADESDWATRPIASVFFGGGTPSTFGAQTFATLLAGLDRSFGLASGAEIALEANPEDLAGESTKLAELQRCGVNRLSIGAQSFTPRHLATLGRRHDADDVIRAVEHARAAGIDDISCDLIFAVPGQTLDEWRHDLDTAVSLAPRHVSTYGLTYEQGTLMDAQKSAGRIRAVSEELERQMYETAIDRLTAAGYTHYEISNFAVPGFESRHNLAYWTWSDYLGLGAGAHGFARRSAERDGCRGRRYANVRSPADFIARAPEVVDSREELNEEMAMEEFILLGLRRIIGFADGDFEVVFGRSIDSVAPALPALVEHGLIRRAEGRTALTREGLMIADTVCGRLADVRLYP